MIVKDKTQMARYLTEAMSSSYNRYRAEQKLEADTGLMKSYLMEAHAVCGEKTPHEEIFSFLREICNYARIQISESEDETLFNIMHGRDSYFLDTSDPRFWIMHTLALSARADKLRNDLVKASSLIDFVWLPTQLFERIAQFGHFRGFGAVHDETPFITDKSGESDVETMHLRLWGGSAGYVLKTLRNSGVFPHSLALSSVRLKYWLPELEDEAIIDNFTFEGKVTALGKSFISHTNLISKVHSDYARTIRNIEKELPIQFVPEDKIPTLKGHPVIISLSKEQKNISNFVSRVFSSALPFRLWGVSEIYDNEFARVYAVDLHIGHKLIFELGRDFIRIYLSAGSCGNTIARFYSNLQQYYDSTASISGGSYEQLF